MASMGAKTPIMELELTMAYLNTKIGDKLRIQTNDTDVGTLKQYDYWEVVEKYEHFALLQRRARGGIVRRCLTWVDKVLLERGGAYGSAD